MRCKSAPTRPISFAFRAFTVIHPTLLCNTFIPTEACCQYTLTKNCGDRNCGPCASCSKHIFIEARQYRHSVTIFNLEIENLENFLPQ